MAKLLLGDKHKVHSPGLLRLLWVLEAWLVGLLGMISRLLPPDTASRLAARLARRIGPRMDKTRIIRRNLKVAFPEKSPEELDQLVKGIWGTLGSIVAEYPHLPTICGTQAEQRLEIVMQDKFPVFELSGKPAVFVTAHLGNWEIGAATIAHLGVPLTVVYTALTNPRMDRLLRNAREALGYRMVERGSAARELVRRLKAGTSVGLIVDQRVDAGEPVPFFGADMLTSVTPAQLALRFDCDLIPVQVQRLEGARFRVTFHRAVKADDPTHETSAQIMQMTRKINALFESWIRERPQEWMCTKRRWAKHLVKPDWQDRPE
ncbi:MAG: lysophospholipid acyltransferase family protein [Thiogranum sp.]